MPWINEEKCIACGICIEKCPVDAIFLPDGQVETEDRKAKIDIDKCIRCGTCHSICPQEAVRHDGEKILELIKTNVERTKESMQLCAKYLGEESEKKKCLERMKKHFNRKKVVAEKTLEKLNNLG